MTIQARVRLGRSKSSVIIGFAAACVFLPAVSPSASAQEFIPLEGIVVYSANRTPTEAAKVGSSVEVITEKELESRSQTYVKDYLETLPGVSFNQNGPPGSRAGIMLRGATNYYVKVLVDGIDVSDPSGPQAMTHFEHLLVGDVSRIEVLKGSQSTLYGGDAVGGVITIDTKSAQQLGFSHSGGVEYGAYNTWRGAYTAGHRDANGNNTAFTVQGVHSDGFSAAAIGTEDDGYRNLTFSGRGEYFLSPSTKIFFAARSLRARYEYDGGFPLSDTDEYGRTTQHAARVGTEFTLLNGALQNTFAIQGMKIERNTYRDGASTGWFDGDRVKAEYRGVLEFNEHVSLLAGVDWEQTGAETRSDPTRHTTDLAGTYVQLMLAPIEGLVLTAGGRLDHHSTFEDFTTHRLTAAYLIPGTGTKLRASLGTGFRTPSLYELFDPKYGNTALQPEESDSWDAGIEQEFLGGKAKLGATYFQLDTDNLIMWGANGYYNVPGVTERQGVELSAAVRVTPGITVTGDYTYTDTEQADGSRLVRVPKHSFTLGLDLQPTDKIQANVTAKYVSDTIDSDFPGFVSLDDYLLLNAKVSYEFNPGWKAYVRAENLLDEKYQTVHGYGTPGLSIYGGLQFALPPL